MDESAARVSTRKLEHLQLAAREGAEGPTAFGWDEVRLIHNALPEIDLDDVDLQTPFLGSTLRAPLWITGMTGGHEQAREVNSRLARAAERHGIAMGLGSQRAALASEALMETYRAARVAAPQAILVANIGAPQLVPQGDTPPLSLGDLERIIASIEAQGLAIHLNFLQEMVQPGGDRNARGVLAAIAAAVRGLSVPVMVKETGAGIARRQARQLVDAGVAVIDVGGQGGTSMVRIEGMRTGTGGLAALAATFDSWGIPTPASVLEARDCGVPVIATGGIRTGLDAARALALGAHMVGVGRPFLLAALESEAALDAVIGQFIEELRVTLFLTGSARAAELPSHGYVLTGGLRVWAEQRS